MKQGHWDRCLAAVAGVLLGLEADRANCEFVYLGVKRNSPGPYFVSSGDSKKEVMSMLN